ncbi:hypothetical protein FRB97_008398, partial [Tulasnella sp. 331]
MAWTLLGHSAKVDGNLWIELLVSIGQRGGPEIQEGVERMTERAVIEEVAASKEVECLSTLGPIEEDLATKFIEEAQRFVQVLVSPPSPLIPCAPPSTPTQVVHATRFDIAPTADCSPSAVSASSHSSISSSYTIDDHGSSRRLFIANPDASLSLTSLKLSDGLDDFEASDLEEVLYLAYDHISEATACNTQSDSTKESTSGLE